MLIPILGFAVFASCGKAPTSQVSSANNTAGKFSVEKKGDLILFCEAGNFLKLRMNRTLTEASGFSVFRNNAITPEGLGTPHSSTTRFTLAFASVEYSNIEIGDRDTNERIEQQIK